MFAEPKDGSEESGIWKRPGFSLPALGGLLTANDQGVLMSKGDKGEELLDANDYPEFLNEYRGRTRRSASSSPSRSSRVERRSRG